MKGIDHLVLCVADLDAVNAPLNALGLTTTPPARHPFGTGNRLVQMRGSFLEFLTVLDASAIPPRQPGQFNFAAFNRDFLARGPGFSMVALDSTDARADARAFKRAGLDTRDVFDFSRKARLPSGEDVTVGFSLAFASHPAMPRAAFFTCQQHAPAYFWNPAYQRHANGAVDVAEVCLVAQDPEELAAFMAGFTGVVGERRAGGITFASARGNVVIADPGQFSAAYGLETPDLTDGARLAAYTLAVSDMTVAGDCLARAGVTVHEAGARLVLEPQATGGTVMAFEAA